MACRPINFSREPIDYLVPTEKLGAFFDDRSDEYFNIIIDKQRYTFQRTISREHGVIYAFSCEPENHDNALLLKSIFEGYPITVNVENASFLCKVSEQLGIHEFNELTKSYIDDKNNEETENDKSYKCKNTFFTILLTIYSMFLKFLINLGVFGKILFTFWDFMGSTYIACFFYNIAVLISTTAFHTVTADPVSFVFVLLPFLLYSLFFTNLIGISIFETFHFRFFRETSLFTKFQTLTLIFIRVTPLGDKIFRRKPFSIGIYYDAMWGALFLIFGVSFLAQLATESASVIVEVFILVFAVGIPPIKHMLLYIFYLAHAFASCFEDCRRRFRLIQDFEDPFLCAMYFRKLRVVDLFRYCFRNRNRKVHNEESESLSSLEVIQETEKKTSNSLCKTVCLAIFSKATCSLYIIIAVLAYVIVKSDNLSTGQILAVVFVFIIIIVPLCTAVSLPWIWIRRWKTEKITPQQLKTELLQLDRSKKYMKWLKNVVSWSPSYNVLRWVSFIANLFFFVLILVSLFVAATEKAQDLNETFNSATKTNEYFNYYTANNDQSFKLFNTGDGNDGIIKREPKRRMTTDPICYTKIKGLEMLQHIALSIVSYHSDEEMNEIDLIMTEYFGANWSNFVTFEKTPFPDKDYDCVLRHAKIKDNKLVIFSIRGTSTRMDILADCEIFFSSFIYDVVLPFIPMFEHYSRLSANYFGKLKIIPRYVFRQFSLIDAYVSRLLAYVQSIKIEDDEDVIVVGHSLGGALAKIVATVTGYSCVAVSAASVASVDTYYKNDDVVLQNAYVDVRPAQDFVVIFDRKAKSSYDIPCEVGAMNCHAVRRTLCQVGAMCGLAEEHRQFCQNFFTDKQINEMIDIGRPYILPSN
ncbi:hypothetical protein TRFO_33344 [Tritrichomonas foetus]|uniref:Fungal lipase-type domain-containing protein n=1 Tax=Tritrichomonas foetus TaxID=1144522 RepID=A0A1J4JLU1_9EUKA|nr:hypothetical protein TRFO_33344 [Tritrichomonas foetus]|eukprot:OHT00051.1 hypothetical protein TRFO_33344 [Tritrichomonas foetus]